MTTPEEASGAATRTPAAAPGEAAGGLDLAALARLDEGLRTLARGRERAS